MELQVLFDEKRRNLMRSAIGSGTIASIMRTRRPLPDLLSKLEGLGGRSRLIALEITDYLHSQRVFTTPKALWRKAGDLSGPTQGTEDDNGGVGR